MENIIELSKNELHEINGGTRFGEFLGFAWGTAEALCISIGRFIVSPGASDETLMNCIQL